MSEEAEVVAPLDAYATAKPNEPTFTLQGGDPLAGPLVRLWASAARVRTGLAGNVLEAASALLKTARSHAAEADDREHDSLLVRATAAEQVSWDMDAYLKGNHRVEDKPAEGTDLHLNELQRIDLHDLKVRIAQKLSSFRCELMEMREALEKAGYTELEPLSDMKTASYNLSLLKDMIEPRRIFQKD